MRNGRLGIRFFQAFSDMENTTAGSGSHLSYSYVKAVYANEDQFPSLHAEHPSMQISCKGLMFVNSRMPKA